MSCFGCFTTIAETKLFKTGKTRTSERNVGKYLLSLGAESLSFTLLSKNIKTKIHGTIILPVVLYGCETWSLTLREERGLRVFENRVLRKIFGPKKEEITGKWRRLHNEELYALYFTSNINGVIK